METQERAALPGPPAHTADHLIAPESTGMGRQSDVPSFGTLAFHALPPNDLRRKVAQVLYDAACWRKLAESEYLAEVVTEWILWNQRRVWSEASTEISKCAKDMADKGWRWIPYSEIERRRRLVSINPCDECGAGVEMVHPFLDEDWNVPPVRCAECADVREPA